MRKLLLIPLLLATVLDTLPAVAAAGKAPPAAPKLIVVISVDQFSAELFDRYRAGFTGGLKRLARGVSFTGYQSHAATETCPGHSTILTGHHPAATGIIANSWYDVKAGASVYCVSVPGAPEADARGPYFLKVDTLGDWLKSAQPGARSVSISGKDRAAIMLGGHHADAVYWWVDGKGFGTSRYAGPADAAVLAPAEAFNTARFAAWQANPPVLWPANAPAQCRALEKSHRFGYVTVSGKVPPDASKGVEKGADYLARTDFQDQLRVSPIMDPMTLEFAEKIIDHDRLGHGPATDLLAVSLSATDHVGHRYGNGGAEMCVQMQALDKALGKFVKTLDSLRVPYVIALTADHGAIDAAERAAEHGIAARRIDGAALVNALNAHLRQAQQLSYDPIVGHDAQELMFKLPAADQPRRKAIEDSAVAWLRQQPEVAQAFTAAEVVAAAPPPGKPANTLTLLERFHESYDPQKSGEIMVALAENATLGMPRGPASAVAGHGSPWDYDRRVPMLFWWRGVKPESRTEPVETVDIAPTLAAIAGIKTPPVDGRCLTVVTPECTK